MEPIRYSGSDVEVRFGDHVEYRSMLFWRGWKPGRVSYVPGTSKLHPEMEHDGLQWIGVSGDNGTFRGVLVEPSDRQIQRSVRFLSRSSGGTFVTPHGIPEGEW